MLLGVILGVVSSVWMYFGRDLPYYDSVQIYFVFTLSAIASSALQTSASSFNSDLVGTNNQNTSSSVFAYIVRLDALGFDTIVY